MLGEEAYLIWNNEEVSPILPYTTIVRLLQWFTSVLKDTAAAGILRFRDRCGHLAHLNIWSEEVQASDPHIRCGCLLQVQEDERAS